MRQAFTVLVREPLAWATGQRSVAEYHIPDGAGLSQSADDRWGLRSARIPFPFVETKASQWLDWLMYHVEVYAPTGDLIGEWLVNRATVVEGNLTTAVGPALDIRNKITVIYTDSTSGDEDEVTVQDSESQARYGVMELVLDGGTVSITEATAQANGELSRRKDPPSASELGSGSGNSISIELVGYERLTDTYYYSKSDGSGTINLSAKIQNVLDAQPNSLYASSYSQMAVNTTQVEENQERLLAREVIEAQLDKADYTFGIYERREAVYQERPSSSTIAYLRQTDSPDYKDYANRPVRPWFVRPGNWLRWTDKDAVAYLDNVTFASPAQFSPSGERTATDIIGKRFELGRHTNTRLKTLERKQAAVEGDYVRLSGNDTKTGALKLDPASGVTTGILEVDAPASSTSSYTFRFTRAGSNVFYLRDDGAFVSAENLAFSLERGISSSSSGARLIFGTGGGSSPGNIRIDSANSNGLRKAVEILLPAGRGHYFGYNGVDGTARVVFDNGTGDVTAALTGSYLAVPSSGTPQGGHIGTPLVPGGTYNLFDDGGTNTLQLIINANGEITVQRTAGSLTYKVILDLIWI